MSGRKRPTGSLTPMQQLAERQLHMIRQRHLKVSNEAMEVVEGLFEKPVLEDGKANPRYNPDAEVTRAQCSMRTHAALNIVESDRKDMRTAVSAAASAARPMGVVVLQSKLSKQDWEATANRMQKLGRMRNPNAAVIDVEADEAKDPDAA